MEEELPEPVDGQTTFNDKLIKRVILWSIERIGLVSASSTSARKEKRVNNGYRPEASSSSSSSTSARKEKGSIIIMKLQTCIRLDRIL